MQDALRKGIAAATWDVPHRDAQRCRTSCQAIEDLPLRQFKALGHSRIAIFHWSFRDDRPLVIYGMLLLLSLASSRLQLPVP